MSLFDGIRKQVSKTADTLAKEAASTANAVKKQAENTANTVMKQAASTANTVVKQAENTAAAVKDQAAKLPGSMMESGADLLEKTKKGWKKQEPNDLIQSEDAIRIMYYLMAADGDISPEEVEKFCEIGKDIDPGFESRREELIQECESFLDKAADEEERYDILNEQAAEAIRSSHATAEGIIQPKVFLWNLLTVAFAEGEYSENEIRLIRNISRLMNIDSAVGKEMESTLRTLLAVEQEADWLKKSGRPYADVELHLNELADRKNAVMQGLTALLLD